MKVENTNTTLAFYSHPWKIWLFSTLFIPFGLFFVLVTLQGSLLVCHRTEKNQGSCEISYFYVFGKKSKKIPLNKLKEAQLNVEQNGGESEPRKEAMLVTTESENIPLISVSSNKNELEEAVYKINSFLKNSNREDRLSVKLYPNIWISLFVLVWNLGAWRFLLDACQITKFSLDKSTGVLRIKRQSLLGTRVIEHPLHDIKSVILHKRDYDGTVPHIPVSLQLVSNKTVGVYKHYESEDPTKVASLICDFLDLPCINEEKEASTDLLN